MMLVVMRIRMTGVIQRITIGFKGNIRVQMTRKLLVLKGWWS